MREFEASLGERVKSSLKASKQKHNRDKIQGDKLSYCESHSQRGQNQKLKLGLPPDWSGLPFLCITPGPGHHLVALGWRCLALESLFQEHKEQFPEMLRDSPR